MKVVPAYRKSPIKSNHLAIGAILLLLILWAQNGFRADGVHALFLLSNYGTWFLLLPWLYGLVDQRNSNKIFEMGIQMIAIIIAHWLVSNTLFYVLKYLLLAQPLLPTISEVSAFLFSSIVSRIIDLALFLGILTWFHQNSLLAQKQLEIVEKEADSQRNKLQALKNQLNPHFLFNTLHNISALIGYKNDKAQKLTILTSNFLRKMLLINELEFHTFNDELAFLGDYLAIESERFHDRLTIEMDVDKSAKDVMVPTMILQPLVENAFKHGIAQMTTPSTLSISVKIIHDHVEVSVINEMPKSSESISSTRIGLTNLDNRLSAHYADQATLSIRKADHQFIALIKIPIHG